jgi:hypothetical protein
MIYFRTMMTTTISSKMTELEQVLLKEKKKSPKVPPKTKEKGARHRNRHLPKPAQP